MISKTTEEKARNRLRARRVHIDTQIEHVIYMQKNCPVHKSEGFTALNRILVINGTRKIFASLNIVDNGLLLDGEAGLSESAWHALRLREGDEISLMHPPAVNSLQFVRRKMYQGQLDESHFRQILKDIVEGSYSNIEIAAFITACAGDNLALDEITALTRAMIASGDRLSWKQNTVFDKHCVGGLPGNRTTPIVVAIIAEAGLTIPKTSSRAITSPAGTADTMATITCVDLSNEQIRETVEKEKGCFVWGGSVRLSPADDILIRIERALDIDSAGQMIASVLSKKSAAGSTHVVVDIPVGPTAKVRTCEEAEKLSYFFKVIGTSLNLQVKIIMTDGSQPVGRGIGPALEALDVLSVLRNEKDAPADLRERALTIAGEILDLSGLTVAGTGQNTARQLLESGRAYKKFEAICRQQGRFTVPVPCSFRQAIAAEKDGTVSAINNRRLSRLARLAGAPRVPGAGILFLAPLNKKIKKGDVLFYIYAEGKGEMDYAMKYLEDQPDIIEIN